MVFLKRQDFLYFSIANSLSIGWTLVTNNLPILFQFVNLPPSLPLEPIFNKCFCKLLIPDLNFHGYTLCITQLKVLGDNLNEEGALLVVFYRHVIWGVMLFMLTPWKWRSSMLFIFLEVIMFFSWKVGLIL